jgi:hypothetical protein
VAVCCKYSDEPAGSGATELVSYLRFEIVTVVNMYIVVFRIVTSYDYQDGRIACIFDVSLRNTTINRRFNEFTRVFKDCSLALYFAVT